MHYSRNILSIPVLIFAISCSESVDERCGIRNDEGALVMNDDHNYRFDGTLDIASQDVTVQIESCVDNTDNDGDGDIDELDECIDLTVDWSQITHDLQGHEMDPVADIDNVAMVIFRYLSQDEVEQKLSDNTLVQSDIGLYVSVETGDETSAIVSDFTLLGNEIGPHQFLEEDQGTYLMYLQKGNVVGVGVMMSQFFVPTASSSETTLNFSNDSTILDYQVFLEDLDPLTINEGSDVEVDWSTLITNGLGQDFESADVDQVMLAYYADTTLSQLESEFLDIELLADEIFFLDIGNETSINLSDAESEMGPFTGIDDSGMWLLALRCGSCANPAPLFLTTLELCQED